MLTFFSVLLFGLGSIQSASATTSIGGLACQEASSPENRSGITARVPNFRLATLQRLEQMLLHPELKTSQPFTVFISALELGKIPGLKTTRGSTVNLSAGGVAPVLNDVAEYYPKLMPNARFVFTGVLMDGIDTHGMQKMRTLQVPVDGSVWHVDAYHYRSPKGAEYILLDNPAFKRFTALPDPKVQGESIYTMRGLESGSEWDELEKQRIYSALSQATALHFTAEGGHVFYPQDSHFAPASYYITQYGREIPLSVKALVHNEGYPGNFNADGYLWERVRKIWSLTRFHMHEYFMQDGQLVMLAPSVRMAEKFDLFSALSVSEGTANGINGATPYGQTPTLIDFFSRVGAHPNGLGEENRPRSSELLKPGTIDEIHADGVHYPEVVKKFTREGYRYGGLHGEKAQMVVAKAEAKRALQLSFQMDIAPDRPLFVGFARMVYQKGMEFVAQNVEHILARGGQVLIGGPVGDSVGAREREMFLGIRRHLEQSGNPHAKNFVFIDGPVKGRMKGLTLAGGDFFLIPSRYEPCGLTDCEALYHGTIPIAHHVGGLDKGKETILYRTDPNNQGWELGQAIDRAFARFADRETFQASQWSAMHEDFSMEKNFERFLQIQRLEVYGKMFQELERLIARQELTRWEAEAAIGEELATKSEGDRNALISALHQMHPDRRSRLVQQYLDTHP